jgi:hypothetical protein
MECWDELGCETKGVGEVSGELRANAESGWRERGGDRVLGDDYSCPRLADSRVCSGTRRVML